MAEIGRAFNTIVEEIAVRLRRPFRIPDAIPTPGNIRYVRGVHRIDRLVTRIIRERREQGGDRGDLLSMLMLARDEEGQPMSERQLRDEVITLLVAGHETRPSRSPGRGICWPTTPTWTRSWQRNCATSSAGGRRR